MMGVIDRANRVFIRGNLSTAIDALHIVRDGYPDKRGWMLVERWDLLDTGPKLGIVRSSGLLENRSIIGII